MHDLSPSWLAIGSLIESGGVKIVLWAKMIM